MIRKNVNGFSLARLFGLFAENERENLEKFHVFLTVPNCFPEELLASFHQLGNRRQVRLRDNNQNPKQSLEDLNRQIKEKKITIENLDLVFGSSAYYGINSVSQRDAYYFTFFQNPVDRYVAHYDGMVSVATNPRSPGHAHAKRKIVENGKTISLQEFADRKIMINTISRFMAVAGVKTETTSRWDISDNREMFAIAANTLKQFDYVGLYDHYIEDVNHISSMLSLDFTGKTIAAPKPSELDADLREQIKKINWIDEALYDAAKNIRLKKIAAIQESQKFSDAKS